MPNRIIREAILSSERMARLNAQEEVLFRRLMSVVDDYGRFEGNPQLIRSRCYPLQIDDVKQADVIKWLAGCRRAGVIQLYAVDGKEYLELFNFGQQLRSASKCPQPPAVVVPLLADASNCSETIGNAHLCVSVSEVVSVAHPTASAVRSQPAAKPEDVSAEVWADWVQLRKAKKATTGNTVLKEARAEAEKAGMTLERFLTVWVSRGSQGMQADWLKPAERVGSVVSMQSGCDPTRRFGA